MEAPGASSSLLISSDVDQPSSGPSTTTANHAGYACACPGPHWLAASTDAVVALLPRPSTTTASTPDTPTRAQVLTG